MKAVVFDLDGTLLDTLQDLYESTNYALMEMGMPLRRLDEVRHFVGNGVRRLIERAVPEQTDEARLETCFAHFQRHYLRHCQDHTRLYPGIDHLLRTLHERGFLLAIVSNKLQAGVDELYEAYFRGVVDVAIGEREGVRRKPAPDMVHLALQELRIYACEAIYVGDSEVDLATARAASLPCTSVLWGFRTREELLRAGATWLVETPGELLDELLVFGQNA